MTLTSCVTSMTGPGSLSWIILVDILHKFTFLSLYNFFAIKFVNFSGINYWLKSELLSTTEVGEFGQFWLGAYTEVSSGTGNMFPSWYCDIRRDTARAPPGTGTGDTRMSQSHGLTGLMARLEWWSSWSVIITILTLQPNNLHGQNCLVMREYHDIFFPIARYIIIVKDSPMYIWFFMSRDYFWNDYDCDESAHYICEHKCFDTFGNRSP